MITVSACSQTPKSDTVPPVTNVPVIEAKDIAAVKLDYDSCKRAIGIVKKNSRRQWEQLSADERGKIFTGAVVKTIAPAWIGTPWTFSGTTEVPQQGSIACGYFVTTVLRDAGLPLARIKLSQCASEEMIRSLVQPKFIKRYSNVPMNVFIESVKASGNGLYIVGLDNHTGLLCKDGEKMWFIHSTFVGTRNVQMEDAALSSVLAGSTYRVTGKISADEKALQRWISL